MPQPIKTRYRLETLPATKGAKGMLHHLSDEESGLQASVAPFAGAEIASLKIRSGGPWLELLDRAEDFSACDRWRGRAPWLWPAVGRNYAPKPLAEAMRTGKNLDRFEWECDGRTFPMPLHGFVMNRQWKVTHAGVAEDGAELECVLADDAQTRRYYPFGFLLLLSFRLSEGVFKVRFRVQAASGNSMPMPFCVGNHLTLRAPLTGVGRFEQIRVFAPIRRAHLVTKLGLLGDATELNFREGVSLADARLHDLVVGPFVPGQALVRLIDPSGIELEVSQQELAVNAGRVSPDQFYFVFYADAGAGLFCPEPWLGLPNSLGTGTAAVGLEPGGIFEWEMAARATLPQGKPIQLA